MRFEPIAAQVRAVRVPDAVLAVATASILAALMVPLPAGVLDLLLAVNLAGAITLLVAALFARDALGIASFPTLLLLGTLFRISLNVSSTRLALADGHAGEVIAAFGDFVVRGDWVVGLVVFAILTLVQFLVVAKGAERVSEVAARFTLDAMPGKQMSIDAELRAGTLDADEARKRRLALERESQMFGAMDGAMKFVKGDVIAGLVIVAVNLLGGTAVGVFKQGLELSEAASQYALIAVGDGLVSQVSSLCMAVAAGLLVTRVASEGDASLGRQIASQLLGEYRALWAAGSLCFALAWVPGMPAWTFVGLAVALTAGGWALRRRRSGSCLPEAGGSGGEAKSSASHSRAVGTYPLTLNLSNAWADVARPGGPFVVEALESLRECVFLDLGVRIPAFQVRVGDSSLPDYGYELCLDDLPSGRGTVRPTDLFALAPPEALRPWGITARAATHPATGEPLSHIEAPHRTALETRQGVEVREGCQLVLDHVEVVLRRSAADLLTLQGVRELLDGLELHAPALVQEALQKVPLPLMGDVLRRLLREGVSIRNLRLILEALVAPSTEGDAVALAERCRQALHRQLSHRHAPSGTLYAYLVDPTVEQLLRETSGLDPDRIAALMANTERLSGGRPLVLLASPDVRPGLQRLCAGALPQVTVLTYAELNPDLQIRPLGRLSS